MSSPRVFPFVAAVHRCARTGVSALLLMACTACMPPPDAPTEKPTEPQAMQGRDAMQTPRDAAHATHWTSDDSA